MVAMRERAVVVAGSSQATVSVHRPPLSNKFHLPAAVVLLLVWPLELPFPWTASCGTRSVSAQTLGKEIKFAPVDGACGDVGPWKEGMCLSDGEGAENEHCGPCLVGEAWDQLRAELGTERVRGTRTTVPTIKHPQWMSATLSGTVMHILLKELLGYEKIRVATTDVRFEIEEAASETCQAMNMEVWQTEPAVEEQLLVDVEDAQPGKAIHGYTAGVGQEALFVPEYLAFSSTHYRSLQDNIPEGRNGTLTYPMDRFPPDGTIGIEELNSFYPAGDPWGCIPDIHGEGTMKCNTGRWYPKQCGTEFPSQHCKELYIPDQSWSEGWFEAMIQNSNLNFSVVYTGHSGHFDIIREKFKNREAVMFYWWQPEPLLVNYPSIMATFPRNNHRCEATYDHSPHKSGVDCGRSVVSLRKLIYADLVNTDPDLFFLWDSAQFSNEDLIHLMSFHVDGGGNSTSMYDAACGWLKSNETVANWRSWLKVQDRCAGRHPPQSWDAASKKCIPLSGSTRTISVDQLLISVGALGAVMILLAAFMFMRTKAAADMLHLPPKVGESVTLVITDIQGSTSLWDLYPREVAEGIALHHRCLRASLKDCHGYEIATEGDSFKCAFRTPEDAIRWTILVQLDLLCAPWNPMIEDGGLGSVGNDSWADVSKLPERALMDSSEFMFAGYNSLDARFLDETHLRGSPRKPHYSCKDATLTKYSRRFCAEYPSGAVRHRDTSLPIPVFRGLRVRMGIHTGIADVVGTNEITKRLTYGGKVAAMATAVADAPAGGQIIASADTVAAVGSMHDLMHQIGRQCKSWSSALSQGGYDVDGMCIIHMGSHLLSGAPAADQSPGLQPTVRSAPSSRAASFFRRTSRFRESLELESVRDGDSAMTLPEDLEVKIEQRLGRVFLPGETLPSQLVEAHELVSIVPWPLRARQWCFPRLATDRQLTPGFHEAPGPKGVTIMFVFTEKFSGLRDMALSDPSFKAVLDGALRQRNHLVRAALLPYHGYEVEGEDCSYVLAFHSPEEAVEYAVLLQWLMRTAVWSSRLLEVPCCSPVMGPDGQARLAGPRLKIGMCTADAQIVQPSMRTGRVEYFGWLMNHAARVAAKASGGQILLHGDTHSALDLARLDSSIDLKACGTFELKGIKRKVDIFEARDQELKDHGFPSVSSMDTSSDDFEHLQPKVPARVRQRGLKRVTTSSIGLLSQAFTALNGDFDEERAESFVSSMDMGFDPELGQRRQAVSLDSGRGVRGAALQPACPAWSSS